MPTTSPRKPTARAGVEKTAIAAGQKVNTAATKVTRQPVAGLTKQTLATDSGPTLSLPGIGRVTLPAPDRLAFYVGLGALAAADMVDWPVALIIAAGHVIHTRSRNRVVEGLAEGVESGV